MTQRQGALAWGLLLALVCMWGSSFLFNKIGVASVPPATLVAGRLGIGSLILLAVMRWHGLSFPPPGAMWLRYVALGLVGNAIPFYLITWGQRVVDSALAGILMAVMPLATLVLAHLLVHGERMTAVRAIGFVTGFAGIVVLMTGRGTTDAAAVALVYPLAVLCGALCYAANSVMTRLLARGDVLVASAGTLLAATAVAVPVALHVDAPWTLHPSFSSLAAIVWLGVGPTAVATLCYFRLIGLAGPTFMSLVNYLSPPVAVLLGVFIMGETLHYSAYAALALILAGIALSQFRRA
jgi:drug/metabolite transporter (DMT)-like permease